MSSMSRGRKSPTQQELRRGGSKTKKGGKKSKTLKRLRRNTRDYSESDSPASGTSGKVPIVKGGSAGRYSEDGKSVNWADKPKGATMKKFRRKKSA